MLTDEHRFTPVVESGFQRNPWQHGAARAGGEFQDRLQQRVLRGVCLAGRRVGARIERRDDAREKRANLDSVLPRTRSVMTEADAMEMPQHVH